jgi:hypothetical protein
MAKILDTILLLALPASGKSEVRRYLAHLDPRAAQDDFHMGPTVQLDDFPYVHLMRVIDDALAAAGEARRFFEAPDRSFIDRRDWGTLIELLNQDYADLLSKKAYDVADAVPTLFARLDRASEVVGIPPRLLPLSDALRARVAAAVEADAKAQLADKLAGYPDTLEGKTLVVEFARGGPDGASMPLPAPHGYEYSLGLLSDALLERAKILYIWVTPEESRRKNEARTNPDDPGSILHHGVPLSVMLGEYGCDDMTWLESQSDRPGTVVVRRGERAYHIPVARFDNRQDRTTFVREAPERWASADVDALHGGLKAALDHLAGES